VILNDCTADCKICEPAPDGQCGEISQDHCDYLVDLLSTPGGTTCQHCKPTYELSCSACECIEIPPGGGGAFATKAECEAQFPDHDTRATYCTAASLSHGCIIDLSLEELVVEVKKLKKESSFNIDSPVGVVGIRG